MSGQIEAASRAIARCRELAAGPYSDIGDGLFRPYLGPAHLATVERVAGWMRAAGLSVRRDAAGSLCGRYEGTRAGAPCLLIGSHLDSVRQGGAYDGVLGVMLGIECVAALARDGVRLPFAVELVAFGDEEGSRFPQSMLGARTLAGQPLGEVARMTDADGITLHDAMHAAGLDVAHIAAARRAPGEILAYLEAHIEQGPVLDSEGLSIAAVEAIAGIRRARIHVHGTAGHAGTVPLAMRQDALAAAAEMVLCVESLARRADPALRAVVGQIEVAPGAVNIIPGQASFTLELRAGDAATLDGAQADVLAALQHIAARRHVRCTAGDHQAFAPSRCDTALTAALLRSITRTGQPSRTMLSGAGHDAMMLAATIPTTMLFIRSPGGISHHPDERVDIADVQAAFDAMHDFVLHLEPSAATLGQEQHADATG